MKVVLLKSVENLGQAGEAADVKRGYYRNFLGPRGLALEATQSNIKLVESQKKKLAALVAAETKDASELKARLDGQKLTFHLRAGDRGQLFGSITSRDVADAIKTNLGLEIERRRIDMENLKTLGDHAVRIRLYPGIVATINVVIEKAVVAGEAEADAEEEKVEFGAAARYGRDARDRARGAGNDIAADEAGDDDDE